MLPLIITHIFTFLVSIIAGILFVKLYRKYKDSGIVETLIISIYFLFLSITYLSIFLHRFPTYDYNINMFGCITPRISFSFIACANFIALLYVLTIFKKSRLWYILTGIFISASLIIVQIFPPVYIGLEWLPSPQITILSFFSSCAVILAPGLLFSVMAIKTKKSKYLLLSTGFLLVMILQIFEGVGIIFMPIRRILIAISCLLIYFGVSRD